MLIYNEIDASRPDGRRTAGGLLRLRRALAKQLPPKHVDGNLLLATWNIREFGFTICATHSFYGKAVADYPPRVKEIDALAQFLKRRAEDENAWAPHMFLVGDLNIFKTTDQTFKKLTGAGFIVPKPIVDARSNANRDKHYDQIAFLSAYLAKRTKDGSAKVLGGA